MAYQKQTWRDYDDTKTELVNMNNGAVVTPERMNHIETGIANSADKQEVTAQLAQTNDKLNNVVTIDITDFGGVGDGETDNTEVIQNAIDSLPTLTMSSYNMTSMIGNVNGGKIKFPRGRFIVKGTIKFKGGILFEGDGFNTIIDHQPILPSDLFSPDLTKPTVINTIQNFQLKNLSLKGSYDVVTGTGLSQIGVDLHNVGNSRLEDLYVTGFETGVNDSEDTIGAYYNTLSNSSVRSCKTNIKAYSAGFSINGCSISAVPSNTVTDYLIDVRGSGVSISNCHIEGQVNEALFNIESKGFSVVGGYSENTRSKRFADIDISKSSLGNINIQGYYAPNYNIRFYGLYKGGAEIDHFVTGSSSSGGITINSKGTYLPNVIKNGSFRNGLFQWIKARSEVTAEVKTENMFGSKQSLRITKSESYDRSAGVHQAITLENANVFMTVLVKKSNDAKAIANLTNSPDRLYNFTKIAEYEGTDWELFGVWVPPLEFGRNYTLHLSISGDSPTGSWVEFSNVEVYSNGFEYFPFERIDDYNYHRIPNHGTWTIGDKVYLNDVEPDGYMGYVCTTSGDFNTNNPVFKGFGKIEV